ncbi:acetolactate synthase large subunit, partial [Streptomyces sp. SID9913]
MTDPTGGDLLADSLINQGVSTIFGIPGVQLDAAADALQSRTDQVDFICARNEQATTYMADGYARST